MDDQNTLVAFTPHELKECQPKMIDWCDKKIQELATETAELTENLAIAIKSKWRSSGLKNALGRAQKRSLFYEKVKAAIQQGYLVIPNFPIDVFAIRTSRTTPVKGTTSYSGTSHLQEPQELPAGMGEYKSNDPVVMQRTLGKNDKGNTMMEYFADEFQDVAFPVVIAKPEVMNATSKAMSLRLFDEIGLVRPQTKRGDPIVIATIKCKHGYSEKRVSFFVAWWLDFEDI